MLRWGPGVKCLEGPSSLRSSSGLWASSVYFPGCSELVLLRSLPAGVFKCGDHLFFFQPLFSSPLHRFEHCCHRGADQEGWTTGLELFSFYFSDFFFFFNNCIFN